MAGGHGGKGWRETGLAGPPVPGRHNRSQTVQVSQVIMNLLSSSNTSVTLRIMRFAMYSMCLWCCGCGCYKDITQWPEVQKTGIVGQRFCSKKDLVVAQNQWTKMQEIATPEEAKYLNSLLGKLDVGTRVKIVRVERHCDGGDWLVEERKAPIGLVENGRFAGRKFAMSRGGFSLASRDPDPVDKHYWSRCDSSASKYVPEREGIFCYGRSAE